MFVDPLGLEFIVVSGGIYDNEGYNYEFIDTAIKKIHEWRSISDEPITWIIADAGWSRDDLNGFINFAEDLGINLQFITSSKQLVNYINGKSINARGYNDARKGDKIKKFVVFAHGTDANGGVIELGYGTDNREDLAFTKDDIDKFSGYAFYEASSAFYSCNTGTAAYDSFAYKWAVKTQGKVYAFKGWSLYTHIMDGQSMWWKAGKIGTVGFNKNGAMNYPQPGNDALADGSPSRFVLFTPYS